MSQNNKSHRVLNMKLFQTSCPIRTAGKRRKHWCASLRCHNGAQKLRCRAVQNRTPPEYHLWLWRNRLCSHLCVANVEIQTGDTPYSAFRSRATEFEKQVRSLGLSKETCAGSSELRKWCENHRNQSYIPEWLLEAWGITLDLSYGVLPQPQKTLRRFSPKSAA
jgi:hypothetical protein